MISRKPLIAGLMLITLSATADDCDSLRETVDRVNSKCGTGETITGICGVLAAVAAPFTMGLSGLACTIPAATTEWMCRHKDFLKNYLAKCDSHTEMKEEWNAMNARVRAESKAFIWKNLEPYIKYRDWKMTDSNDMAWENDLYAYVGKLMQEGIDLCDIENEYLLEAQVQIMELNYLKRISDAEEEYQQNAKMWINAGVPR